MKSFVKGIIAILLLSSFAFAADERIQFGEKMRGANAPGGLEDTLNRLTMQEHNSDGTHAKLGPNTYFIGKFSGIADAITQIGSATATLIIDRSIMLSSDITIPSTLALQITQGGMITKASGTLTINGPFIAGSYQIFSGFNAGDITGLHEARQEWWGTDYLALQKAIASGATRNYLTEGTGIADYRVTADPTGGGPLGQGGGQAVLAASGDLSQAYLLANWYFGGDATVQPPYTDRTARYGASPFILFSINTSAGEALYPGDIAFYTNPVQTAGTQLGATWTRRIHVIENSANYPAQGGGTIFRSPDHNDQNLITISANGNISGINLNQGSGFGVTKWQIFLDNADNKLKIYDVGLAQIILTIDYTTGKVSFSQPIVIEGHQIHYANTAPASGTWLVGDRVFNASPAVGQPKSWVCTVAGTPGTWVSEGNL